MMSISLHFLVESTAVSYGGTGLAAQQLGQALARQGVDVRMHLLRDEQPSWPRDVGPHLFWSLVPRSALGRWRFLWRLARDIGDQSVVHIHGIWNPWWALVAQFLHWRGVPFVVSPHGSLEPGALSIRRHKKLAALVLYQKRALKQTNALVVTSDKEARGVAALRFGVPIQVISNGVQLHSVTSYALDARGVKGDNGPRTLLFLSRIHPIKGLSILVRAWARVRKDGWRVVVAGNDEQGHLAEIQALAETLGVRADFEFPGAVGGEAKLDLFEQADVFVLPTKSENFGIVVAEALSHGVPVITTHGAPWSGLVDNGCGWWCPIDEVALAQAMAEAMDLPRQTLAAMGSAGREWVRREFNWDTIARQALETLYLPALQSRA